MAILNTKISVKNPVPLNGKYIFTARFLDGATGAQIVDSRFPQNQVFTYTTLSDPQYLPVQIGDGTYSLNGYKLHVKYKELNKYIDLSGVSNCQLECENVSITNVVNTSGTNYTITLSGNSVNTYVWKLTDVDGNTKATGNVNVNGSTFNITTTNIPEGKYIFELNGTTCKGSKKFPINIVNTLPNCSSGPTIFSIISSTATSTNFSFNGVGVFGITWRIKQGDNVVRNGVIKHTSVAQTGDVTFNNDKPTITYASLSAGTYTLEIEGNTCKSAISSASITITGTTPLGFSTGSPSVTGSAGNYTLALKINKSGIFNTTILNTTTGTYYKQNEAVSYTSNVDVIIPSLPVGIYHIKIDTLETDVTIANSGGSPCTQGPTLSSIQAADTTSLRFLFDGVNVTSIKWRIKQSGNLITSGVVFPSNNTPTITYSLSAGSYTLEIEGNNCTSSVSTSGFTITGSVPTNNSAVIVKTVGNKTYKYINGRDVAVNILPSGNVQLVYNELSTSATGKQVKAWLMNGNYVQIPDTEKNALLSGTGLALPSDVSGKAYTFILYFAATDIVSTFAQLRTNSYAIFGPEGSTANSKQMMYCQLSIKTTGGVA